MGIEELNFCDVSEKSNCDISEVFSVSVSLSSERHFVRAENKESHIVFSHYVGLGNEDELCLKNLIANMSTYVGTNEVYSDLKHVVYLNLPLI